ncbi:MAG TPA: amidohydrolase family protein [bacterium]|nr:amidohydrolase family protein [bacterium]
MKLSRLIACLAACCAPALYAGTIAEIQQGTLTGSQTVTGVVNLVYPSMEFFIADADGAYNGICISQSTYGPEIGDNVTLTGTVSASNGQTVINSLTAFSVNSEGNDPFPPVTVSTADVALEEYEGCLVRVEDVYVSNENIGSGKWQVQTGSPGAAATVDDELDYNYFPKNSDEFDAVVGIVERDTTKNPAQWLQPRFTADFAAPEDIIPHYALHGTVVTMDDARNVYDGYYIEVQGDLIAGVTPDAPGGVDVIEVDGLIFPALINSHDHPSKDIWDIIPLPYISSAVYPDIHGTYQCLNDWSGSDAEPATKQMYSDFQYQAEGELTGSLSDAYAIAKLAEVRMASSGCAVTQGQCVASAHYNDNSNKLGVGIINCERFPGRAYDSVFPRTDGTDWTAKHADAVNGKVDRYILHLCQSWPTGCEAQDWNWWKTLPSYDGRTTIIHGNSLNAADFAEFTTVDGNRTALSWACKCNILYYGQTADIPGALAAGALVSIGCDATPWGNPNMLAELNYCKYYSDQAGWTIQSLEFADMVTRNGAVACGREDDMGTIETGKIANFMVIDDGPGDPYDDLLMVSGAGAAYDYSCGPRDVRLTVCAGRPIYGDADLFNTVNFPFIFPSYLEDVEICGTGKKLSIARHNSSNIEGAGDLFRDFYAEWWGKYYKSGQYPCDFVPVDPAGWLPPTPVPTATPLPGTYVITTGADDAQQHATYFDSGEAYLHLGSRSDTIGCYYTGFRFTGIQVPPGATVTSADLIVTQYTSYNTALNNLHVGADDVDDSPQFTAADDGPLHRTLTSAQVDWAQTAWTVNQEYSSPDLSAVVQEIVDRPGWEAGNSLTVIVYADVNGDLRRRIWSYNGDPTKSARLEIEYSAATPTPTPEGFKTPSTTPTTAPTATPSATPYGFESPSPTPSPQYVNLLPNPSFESWSSSTCPDDWIPYSNVELAAETAITHSSATALRLELSTTAGEYGRGLYADAQPVTEENPYTFQMWVYSASPGSMGITANWYVGGSTIYWDTVVSASSGQWELLTVTSTAPAGATDARCWVRGFADNTFCGYADDGACYEGLPAPTPVPTPVPGGGGKAAGDYDGDGTSDIAVFRPSVGLWAIRSVTRAYYGFASDTPVPQDFDGNGSWEIAVFRPSNGKWLVRGGVAAYYGVSGDETVPADYDGDGTADIAVFRPSNGKWLVRASTSAYFGASGDETVPADYDGDGTADIAVFRPGLGKWLIRGGVAAWFGISTDGPVPADYDGDGTSDIAVWRPSNGKWLVRGKTAVYYGVASDVPVPADYDGDGTDDIGLFRAAKGKWLVNNPSVASVYFGSSSDEQVTNPYPGD